MATTHRYNDTMNSNYETAVKSLVNDILKPTARFMRPFCCPECGLTFTDPEEYLYGHDCEES